MVTILISPPRKFHHSHAVSLGWLLAVLILSFCALPAHSRHTRLYACILADNTPGNFLGASSLGSGLWISDDTGKTWGHHGWKHGKTYSVDILNSSKGKTIYLARGDGLLRSTDAGATWKMLTDWRHREVTDVAVLQSDPSLIIITTAVGMWRSQDTGATWGKITKGVESFFLSRVRFHPQYPNRMAAATEKGLFTSNDRGESWRLSGVDSASINDVRYSSDLRLLWVGDKGEVQGEKMYPFYYEDLIGKLWCIEELSGRYAVAGQHGVFIASSRDDDPVDLGKTIKYPYSLCSVGNILLVGTLGDGIYRVQTSGAGAKIESNSLPRSEVWTIRKVEIE